MISSTAIQWAFGIMVIGVICIGIVLVAMVMSDAGDMQEDDYDDPCDPT